MSLIKKTWVSIFGIAAALAAMSFLIPPEKKASKGKLTLQFHHYVSNEILKLDSATYKNNLGQTYTISKFKYYIGNVQLKRVDGTTYTSPDYLLLNEEETISKQAILKNIPEGDYTSIDFILGVDSTHNCSGAQTGALEPMKGMFWAWNTGYIFLKLEGYSPVSQSSGHILEFHIGGYKQPANCIRHIHLDLKNPLKVVSNENTFLHVKTDAAEIFKTPVDIDFTKTSSVTDFHNAEMVADNYQDIFSILNTAP